MNMKQTYELMSGLTIEVGEGAAMVNFVVGKKNFAVPVADVKLFCQSFLGHTPSTTPVEPSRTAKVLSDFDNRQAVSSTPIKSITMEEWNKIERPPKPVPGVTFSGAVNMAPTPSFKKS